MYILNKIVIFVFGYLNKLQMITDSKINSIQKKIKEAIAKRESKLKLAESEELAEMIDSKMVKTLQKEINELKKRKNGNLYKKNNSPLPEFDYFFDKKINFRFSCLTFENSYLWAIAVNLRVYLF